MNKDIKKESIPSSIMKNGATHSDIRTSPSSIRKNICAKCSNPLPVTIKKEIVCPVCGTTNLTI